MPLQKSLLKANTQVKTAEVQLSCYTKGELTGQPKSLRKKNEINICRDL